MFNRLSVFLPFVCENSLCKGRLVWGAPFNWPISAEWPVRHKCSEKHETLQMTECSSASLTADLIDGLFFRTCEVDIMLTGFNWCSLVPSASIVQWIASDDTVTVQYGVQHWQRFFFNVSTLILFLFLSFQHFYSGKRKSMFMFYRHHISRSCFLTGHSFRFANILSYQNLYDMY